MAGYFSHVELGGRERPGDGPVPREVLTVLTVNERLGWTTAATLFVVKVLALVIVMPLAWSGAWESKAEANGSVTKYTTLAVGPYDISLGTAPADPRVGRLHLTVKLAEASSKQAISGADVAISGRGPGASEADFGPLPTITLASTPEDYDLDVELDREGAWVFTVYVDAELGEATAEFPLDVTKPNPWLGMLTLSLAIVLLLIVGLSMRRYFAARRAQGRAGR